MIKYQSFQFEELPSPNHWVDFACFADHWKSTQEFADVYSEVKIQLSPEKVYQIAFDQSSSNTGIFIKDYNNTEAYMIEVMRRRGEEYLDYIYDLEMFLHSLGEGCKFSHILYERPIKSESFQSSRVLFQLEGMIGTLCKRYTEFSTAKTDNIVNSSWRSVVVDSSLEDAYGRKESSRLSVCDIFKWASEYGPSLYKDNDVFEAIGIMMGWFFTSFDPLGRPYVRGDKTDRAVGGFCLPGIPGEKVKAMLAEKGIEAEFLVENPNYTIYQNLVGGVKPFGLRCVEITSKYTMLCLCVECNLKWFDPSVMTLIICDAATVNSDLKAITGGEFHFVV